RSRHELTGVVDHVPSRVDEPNGEYAAQPSYHYIANAKLGKDALPIGHPPSGNGLRSAGTCRTVQAAEYLHGGRLAPDGSARTDLVVENCRTTSHGLASLSA